METNRLLRLVFSLALLPFGGLLVVLAPKDQAGQMTQVGQLVDGLGLSLIVAGIMSTFREVAILRLEVEETATDIARRITQQLFPPSEMKGIRLVSSTRRGYDGYYRWAMGTGPCDLFVAGRSVLQRLHGPFGGLQGATEHALVAKLREGSVIRILFLDPRSDLVGRLAREEHQTAEQMMGDHATSVGICQRLHELVAAESALHPRAELHVRVYDEVPYFAYHRERDLERPDQDLVLIGFYFASALGSDSAAYEVVDPSSRWTFEGHFTSIYDRSSAGSILEVNGSRNQVHFNHRLYDDLRAHLAARLGQDECDRRLAGV